MEQNKHIYELTVFIYIYTVNKGFAIDWCAFRLLVLDQKTSSEDTTAIYKELGRFFTTEDPTGLAI